MKPQEELITLTHHEQILLVTEREDPEALSHRYDLTIKTLVEYPQPQERKFLILLIDKHYKGT